MIARRLAVLVLVPSLACASFEPDIIEPVDPSLSASTVQQTQFELGPSSPPPVPPSPSAGSPSPSRTASDPPTPPDANAGTASGATTSGPATTGDAGAVGAGGAGSAGLATAEKVGDEVVIDRVEGQPEPSKAQKIRNGFFVTGIILAGVGGATVLGAGIAGRITQSQIKKGYDDDNLTHAREHELRDRGDTMNVIAATGGAVGILGIAMFSIALGVDYIRCGTLTTKRRKDCVPRERKRR